MNTVRSAVHEYCQATRPLPKLSESQQVLNLKFELFHALERAHDFQDHARALELRVAQLKAPPREREAALDAFARQLHDELALKSAELDAAKRDLADALASAEKTRKHIARSCHNFIATLEHAAGGEAAERPDDANEEQAEPDGLDAARRPMRTLLRRAERLRALIDETGRLHVESIERVVQGDEVDPPGDTHTHADQAAS
jgi:hypothetical protein